MSMASRTIKVCERTQALYLELSLRFREAERINGGSGLGFLCFPTLLLDFLIFTGNDRYMLLDNVCRT